MSKGNETVRIVYRKKKGGHAAHHGGAWKVAYADFVTAMMALFMVMWLLASTDQKSRQEISNYFRSGLVQVVEQPSDGTPQTTSVFISAMMPSPPPTLIGKGSGGGTSAGATNGNSESAKSADRKSTRLNASHSQISY